MKLANKIQSLRELLAADDAEQACAFQSDSEERSSLSFEVWIQSLQVDLQTGKIANPGLQSELETRLDSASNYVGDLLEQLQSLEKSSQAPMLAITGLLNAGKSSLLASFLSEEGQQRVLIGAENSAGTHRFVLWFPESWKNDQSLWTHIEQQIQAIFGQPPELLAANLDDAQSQYNGSILDDRDEAIDPMSVPLVAWDKQLNLAQVALMDCPDIQTGLSVTIERDESEFYNSQHATQKALKIADRRAAVLAKAIRLSSAFLIVVSANSLRDGLVLQLLETLQQGMPGLKRFLFVNRVPRRYDAMEIAREATNAYGGDQLNRVYMAYHFDGPSDRQKLPRASADMHVSPHMPLPVFFQVHPQPTPQPPAEIPETHYAQSLGGQLDASQLSRDAIKSLCQQLIGALRVLSSRLSGEQRRGVDIHRRIHQAIAMAATSTSLAEPLRPDQLGRTSATVKLRLHASREIIEQIAESLERTAPWWAFASVKVNRFSKNVKQWFSDTASRLPSLKWFGEAVSGNISALKDKFRSGETGRVISAEAFCDQILQRDSALDLEHHHNETNRAELLARCSSAITRFQSESQTRLNESQLDEFTTLIWSQMRFRDRLWQQMMPAALIFAPLIAVMTLPIDFGGSAVLFSASVSEMLLAGAAGAGAVLLNKDNMPKIAEEKAAFQQVGDLFAITCDAFGIQRPSSANSPHVPLRNSTSQILASELPVKRSVSDPVVQPIIEANPVFTSRLEEIIESIEQEVS